MVQKRKWLLIGIALLMFAAVKVVALYWWTQRQPAIEAVSACDVRIGCTLPDGSKLQFSTPLSVKSPFDIRLDNVPSTIGQISVSFSMRDMDMGFNRYDLKPQADGSWLAADVRLPLCTQTRYDYLADIRIGEKTYQVGFTAE